MCPRPTGAESTSSGTPNAPLFRQEALQEHAGPGDAAKAPTLEAPSFMAVLWITCAAVLLSGVWIGGVDVPSLVHGETMLVPSDDESSGASLVAVFPADVAGQLAAGQTVLVEPVRRGARGMVVITTPSTLDSAGFARRFPATDGAGSMSRTVAFLGDSLHLEGAPRSAVVGRYRVTVQSGSQGLAALVVATW